MYQFRVERLERDGEYRCNECGKAFDPGDGAKVFIGNIPKVLFMCEACMIEAYKKSGQLQPI